MMVYFFTIFIINKNIFLIIYMISKVREIHIIIKFNT